ncbi:MauE/DoxX family redox-associated membrane protein [Sphingobacterium bovistauri]|uniref:Methylamine utilisation protein MauE domain-containing protein n=1 Tax=Sphingobacterium bovistauri TaxID=2781959 RepID=A0ABS7Z520_9SPHI|nr:MauE/DoxX family redox-associated membrane protein [Sphingobacterium bovistauri]MCA5004059.1 hypothetical protein [Sphingobacterium bovistauri]
MKKNIYHTTIVLLLLLWIPVTLDKIINFNNFQSGILRQPLPRYLTFFVISFLPIIETVTITLLLIDRLRLLGLFLSSILMAIFTSYVALAVIGTWEKLPCGCGSVISGLNWTEHLMFNIAYLVISLVGLTLGIKIKKDSISQFTIFKISKSNYQKQKVSDR